MSLAASVGDKTELTSLANQMADDLLNMKGWEGATSYAIEDKPLSKEIVARENNIRLEQADVSRLNQSKADLQQDRDLAWKAYSTLLSKQLEVKIAAATEGTEVRFASPATPPSSPKLKSTPVVLIGLAVGLLLGLLSAFVLSCQGAPNDPRYYWERIRSWRKSVPSAQPDSAPETVGSGSPRAAWLSRRVLLILLVVAIALLGLAAIALAILSSQMGTTRTTGTMVPVVFMEPTRQPVAVSDTGRTDPPMSLGVSAPSVATAIPIQTPTLVVQHFPTPVPTATPVTYVVASGDTLSRIATRFGVTVSALAAANNLQDPGKIRAGTVLIIPVGSK
jgi:hypothetical protein